jgi:hypothetical protein
MKFKALCLAILVFSGAALSAFALAEAAESIDLILYDPPLPMDGSWEPGDMEGEPDSTLPEGYFVADLWQGDLLYFALYRSDGEGGNEILFLIDVNHDDADNLNYLSGSYDQSGGKYLYFMMIDGATSHGLLYCYDIAANGLRQVLDGPCSNNAILPDGDEDGGGGLCLLLNGDSIRVLDLRTAEVVKSVSIEELGGMPEIEGSFFAGALKQGERKYTYLEKDDEGLILLNTVVVQWHPVSDIRKCVSVYDRHLNRIVDTVVSEGEF